MVIKSNVWDLDSVPDDAVFHFPDGIPGFGDAQNFSLSSHSGIQPFVSLKCVDKEGVGLFCINPFTLDEDYVIKLHKGNQTALMVSDPIDVVALSLVTRSGRPEDFTANLLAPLVINVRNRVAKQLILDKYPVRVNVLDALRRNTSKSMGRV